jgi:hypothetical protein
MAVGQIILKSSISIFLPCAVSILGGVRGIRSYFWDHPPPFFSEAGGKFHIEKEGKRSTNIINSHFSIKIPHVFRILE